MAKQLEFEFMEEIRRKERRKEKLLSIWGCIAEGITAVSSAGTLAIMVFYDRAPSVYETVKGYIKSLF